MAGFLVIKLRRPISRLPAGVVPKVFCPQRNDMQIKKAIIAGCLPGTNREEHHTGVTLEKRTRPQLNIEESCHRTMGAAQFPPHVTLVSGDSSFTDGL